MRNWNVVLVTVVLLTGCGLIVRTEPVILDGFVVTAIGISSGGDRFCFASAPDGAYGVKLLVTSSDPLFPEIRNGNRISFSGNIKLINGLKTVDGAKIISVNSAITIIKPFVLNHRDLCLAANGCGVALTGMPVEITGKCTYPVQIDESGQFVIYIDDGWGTLSDEGRVGIKVHSHLPLSLSAGDFIMVKGIAVNEKASDGRMIPVVVEAIIEY